MLNCDLSAISCSDINFSGCTFGWSENSTDVDVATRFAKKIQNCDMKACSFNGLKFTGDWVKVITYSPAIARPVSCIACGSQSLTRRKHHTPRHLCCYRLTSMACVAPLPCLNRRHLPAAACCTRSLTSAPCRPV